MKGYIVLKDGNVFCGEFEGAAANFLGNVNLTKDGNLSMVCDKSGNCVAILDDSADNGSVAIENGIFKASDYDTMAAKFSNGKSVLGKLVIDDLPLDYHLYDVKTWLGYEESMIA
jgi:hypothetical protein